MQTRIIALVTLFSVMITVPVVSQEIPVPKRDSRLGFSPREHINNLAAAKARQLERQWDFEKLLQSEAVTNWQEYDISYYDIDWRVDHINEIIYGEVGIYGFPTIAELDSVVVNLMNDLTIDSIYNSSGLMSFTHVANHVNVELGAIHTPQDQIGFTIVYHGHPGPGIDGMYGLYFTSSYGNPLIYNSSEPYHSRTWWPCNDIPIDKADSVDIRITIDNSLTASTNGVIISQADNGDNTHTTHWKHRYPIPTYLVCLGICNYQVWEQYYHYSPTDSMPIFNYVYPSAYTTSLETFSVTPYTLELFATLFGEYPFVDERYGHTHAPIGGMEYQTNTFISSGASQETVVHEIAHQWWGDLVTCRDWPNIWLNEGFATYCEGLYYESIGGSELYHDYMYDITYLEYPPGYTIYVEDTSETWYIFTSRVYRKGAWVLHMLRHITGDEIFYDILDQYKAQYSFGTAVTEDFQQVCESVSGLDLEAFFQQWIYGRCQPTYRHAFYTEEAPGGGWDTYVHLRQIQTTDPPVFVMPIDLRINMYDGDPVDFVIQNDQREQDYSFHTDNYPKNIELDPNKWTLSLSNWEQYGLRILTDSLSDGTQGEPYLDSIIFRGGYPGSDQICAVIGGEWPVGLSLEPYTGVISGTTYVSGDVSFTIEATDILFPGSFADTMVYSINFTPTTPRPGDANVDTEINIGDAVYIVQYIFNGGPAPAVSNWADINADCAINVGDVVYLISFVFKSGPDPQLGCVE
jgi:hypothetical protein